MSGPEALKKKRKSESVDDIVQEAEKENEKIGVSIPISISILQDVCICLTGLPASKKTELHNLVEALGGRYRRDLVTQKTTHLIAEKPEGEKYIQANKCPHIEVVTPKWLELCAKKRQRVSEVDFRLMGGSSTTARTRTRTRTRTHIHDNMNTHKNMMHSTHSHDDDDATNTVPSSLEMQVKVNQLLFKSKIPPNPLFSNCSFFLVGFPDIHNDSAKGKGNGNGNDLLSSNKKSESSSLALKRNLCTLIRRCMGTIFWEPNRNISHVIVNEQCDIKTRNDASNFCRYHPKSPTLIAPEWIISCLQQKHLVNTNDFPPRRRVTTLKMKKKVSQTPIRKNTKHQIFNGLFFHILHPQENHVSSANVIFNADKIEKVIASHGGQILSKEGIHVLQKNSSNMHTNRNTNRNTSTNTVKVKNQKRKCFLVNLSGPFDLEKTIEKDALLRHISQHNLCLLIPVNAIWLQACEASKTAIDPFEHEELFVPQSLPFRKLKKGIKLKVAVTGFMGSQRTAIRFTLVAIGAEYTENMSKDNTHLICNEATGPKYLKAVEWGLHVVTEDWLFHIVQFGHEIECERSYNLLQTTDAEASQETTILSSQDY